MQDLADFKLQCIFTVPELLICPTLRFFFFLLHWTCFTAAPSRCLVEEQQWKREINNMNPAECGRTYPGIQGARVLSVTWAQPTAEPSKAPPSQLYVCVCGCKGAQQWLEHVLTFILRNCARSPPKRPPVCLFFFVSADRGRLQRVARKLNVALKSFESVFSKFCPRFEASPWVPSNIKVLAEVC